MRKTVIELLKPITLEKENCPSLVFKQGTILKVLMQTPTGLLVCDDQTLILPYHLKIKMKCGVNSKCRSF